MNIGVDLDNTLVNYDAAFLVAAEFLQINLPVAFRSKTRIRKFLRTQPNGESTWQKLQGLAYGRYACEHARLYPGVMRFLWRCRWQGDPVTVISHKTEYGHADGVNISLRQAAIDFLTLQGLLDKQNSLIQEVIFKNTREEKLACIAAQTFDWFIDDLPEVIDNLKEMERLKVIFFNPTGQVSSDSLSDWQQIDDLIHGVWTFPELNQLSCKLMNLETVVTDKLVTGRNAGVYRLTLSNQVPVKLKIYPVDSNHDRLLSEFIATKTLSTLGFRSVPKPLAQDIGLGIGLYEWIEGEPVQNPNQQDLTFSLEFLKNLHAMKNSEQFLDAPVASAACFSGKEIWQQIQNRLGHFDLPRKGYFELNYFFEDAFFPVLEELVAWTQNNWPYGTDFDAPLARSEQTLSPSDFGFHNAIRRYDGSLVFSDFEYFGWDDPVKLMSDFSFHPGMNLTTEQKLSWLKGALAVYGDALFTRFKVCRPLYGLIWCLILLNDFRPEIWQRRLLAHDSKQLHKQEILQDQLMKAQHLLQGLQESYKDGIFFKFHGNSLDAP